MNSKAPLQQNLKMILEMNIETKFGHFRDTKERFEFAKFPFIVSLCIIGTYKSEESSRSKMSPDSLLLEARVGEAPFALRTRPEPGADSLVRDVPGVETLPSSESEESAIEAESALERRTAVPSRREDPRLEDEELELICM